MNASRDLEAVFFTVAFVLPDFCVLGELGAVTHHVFVAAFGAAPDGNAFVFVGEEVKHIIAAFTFHVDEVVNWVSIEITVAKQFHADIRMIVSVPVFAAFPKCHVQLLEMQNARDNRGRGREIG